MPVPPVLAATFALALVPFRPPSAPLPPRAFEAPHTAIYGAFDHLRPQGSRVEGWLRDARRRSPTIRRLLERIERSEVIVYLDISRALPPDVSACLTWMAATASGRILRVSFKQDLGTTEAMALLGHELQHVVEVIEHPEVRSPEALLDLYTRIGHPSAGTGQRWDTADAIAIGTLVRLEATSEPRPDRRLAPTAGT